MRRAIVALLAGAALLLPPAPAQAACSPGEWCTKTIQAANNDGTSCVGGTACSFVSVDNGNLRMKADRVTARSYYVFTVPGSAGGTWDVDVINWQVTSESYYDCMQGDIEIWDYAMPQPNNRASVQITLNPNREVNRRCVVEYFTVKWRSMS